MKDIRTYMNILKVVLATIGIAVCLFLFAAPNNTAELSEIESYRDGAEMNLATYYTIFVLIACVALILIFFVTQLISDPKKTIMSIIGIVASFVLYIVLYAVGTKDTYKTLGLSSDFADVSNSTIAATTAGFYVVFIGLAVAIVAILAGRFLGKVIK